MFKRTQTKQVKIGKINVGHSSNVVIQSMTNTKTSDIEKTVKQINELVSLGCKLVRVAILDSNDLSALKTIVKKVKCPIIADIHFQYKYAIEALKNGAKAIRINPGNIGGLNNFKKVIETAKKYNSVIRIGINTGSLPTKVKTNKQIIDLMKLYVSFAEKNKFTILVLSIKSSDVNKTIELNKMLAQSFNYPIHIGLTEAGPYESAIIRSTLALDPILKAGVGDTIRISITGNPTDEVKIAKLILNECGISQNLTKIISCPTCGRKAQSFFKLHKELVDYINANPIKNAKVAIMGCYVNGIRESHNSDLGIFGNNTKFVIIYKNKTIGTFQLKDAIKIFIKYYIKLM